jgi:signal transduction histidine kinase
MKATRRFAADAGHEMRTPLTGMRANLDALERNPDLPVSERLALVRAMTAEQERVVRLLEGLQALARGDAAESLPREEVEVGDLVDAAAYAARRRHPNSVIDLEDRIADATVLGWPSGLRLIVDNLVDNAALHGRPGGSVRVALDCEGAEVVLRVDDDGPGIPEGERGRLMEPFARGHGTVAPGTGLGLAIVAQQVALHGGSLRFGDSELGGLGVEVRLPATGSAPPPTGGAADATGRLVSAPDGGQRGER